MWYLFLLDTTSCTDSSERAMSIVFLLLVILKRLTFKTKRVMITPEQERLKGDNMHMDDVRLSWKARAIMEFILRLPEGWTAKDIIEAGSDGANAVYSGLSELVEAGYLVKVVRRDEMGRLAPGSVYERL